MDKYPKFIFDNDSIKKLRKSSQLSYEKDDKFAFYFIRPISIYFSKFIVDKTNISANQVTIFMSILGIISPIIIYFLDNYVQFIFVSVISYFFIYFLDMVDGEVARMRKKTSELGVMYDMSLWYSLSIFNIVYIYKLLQFNNFSEAVDILMLAIFAYTINLYKYAVYSKYREVKATSDSSIYLFLIIFIRHGSFILFPILILVLPKTIFMSVVLLYLITFSLYNLYGIFNISKTLK